MYSGTDGVQMTADIFFGIVHYQRLRHMVSDKFQVRSQGPIDQVRYVEKLSFVLSVELGYLILRIKFAYEYFPSPNSNK